MGLKKKPFKEFRNKNIDRKNTPNTDIQRETDSRLKMLEKYKKELEIEKNRFEN